MGTVGALYGAADGATYDMLGLYNDEQVCKYDVYFFLTLLSLNTHFPISLSSCTLAKIVMHPAHMSC